VHTEPEAARLLASGRVVAAATETFFALLADVRSPEAIAQVFQLKQRDLGKGVALLLPNREAWLELVVEIPPLAGMLADAFWPGPLTIALPARATLDPRLLVNGTVGVRWPASSPAGRIAAELGWPLTATSCNVAGQPPCTTADEVRQAFAEALSRADLDLVEGTSPGGAPSTIVTINDGRLHISREGAISRAAIERVAQGQPLR
jgi:L-threonylcarbamoyladenylate synthase